MSYYIPISGSCIENATPRAPLLAADCLIVGSLPGSDAAIWQLFQPVSGFDISQFEHQVRAQKLTPWEISMGCYYQGSTSVVRHIESQQLYLQVGQSGWGAYFKLRYEEDHT